MFDSFGSFGTNNPDPTGDGGIPLIPGSAGMITHVTAQNLAEGTALVGVPWTMVGSPLFVKPTGSTPKRAGYTSFTDADYFSHPLIPTGGSYTYCIITNIDIAGNDTCPLSNLGIGGATGFLTQNWSSSGASWLGPYDVATGSFASKVPLATGFNVLAGGYDAGGAHYNCQVNGSTGTNTANLPPVTPVAGVLAALGRHNINAGSSIGAAVIYEVSVSSDAATVASLSALYAAILANV